MTSIFENSKAGVGLFEDDVSAWLLREEMRWIVEEVDGYLNCLSVLRVGERE